MKRRGVTLLEVLFAMLIGTIGLLGAIALLPVAMEQANKGREADAGANVGESAIDDFKVRGFYLPDLWVVYDGMNFLNFNGQVGHWQYYDGSNSNYYDASSSSWKKPDGTAANYSGQPPTQNAAFCFDPLGVAKYLPGTPVYATFPYGRTLINTFPSGRRMPVMIRAGSARYTASGMSLAVSVPYASVSPQFAESVCFSHDELNLLRPGKPSDPAILSLRTNSADPVSMRPEVVAQRQYSWFATLCPKTDGQNDEYVLSIVIVYRRPLPLGTPDQFGERVTGIVLTDGITGGDAQINGAAIEDVNVTAGDWVLLIGSTNPNNGSGSTTDDAYARYSWYRVVQSEAEATQTSASPPNFQRNITLYGPDWNIPNDSTYAVMVTGVRGVYERTIRIQRTSLWY